MKTIKEGENMRIIKFCETISGKTVIDTFFGSELTEKWEGNKEI